MATSVSCSISKLEELAFEVLLKEYVYKATPNTIQFVRDCIDNQLVGKVKKNVRYIFLYHITVTSFHENK